MEASRHDTPGLYVIAAPSGGGKSSLIRALIEGDDRLRPSISHTTRPPRPSERDGEHYHFVDEDTFRSLIDRGDFLEYALVFGDYKGTGRQAVERMMADGHDVLLDIDWQGARQVREAYPLSTTIFILPPSLEVLDRRLRRRGQDSEDVIQDRMRRARDEISHWEEFDFVVINDDFETALEDLRSIIRTGEPAHPTDAEKLSALLAELLGQR